jgi:nicotinamidase-related amidase
MQIPEHLRKDFAEFQKKCHTPGTPEHQQMEEALEQILKCNPFTGKPIAPKSAAAVRAARKAGLPVVIQVL